MMPQRFDVFLCHNTEDKPTVIQIAKQLQQYNLKPWLDQWELRPGTTLQLELERQIRIIPAAAVFVGKAGIGPWQQEEIYSLLQQFVQRRCLVIPVLLPNAPRKPDLPIFLANRMWVDFRVEQPDPIYQLVWGITKRKPAQEVSSQPTSQNQNTAANQSNIPQIGKPVAEVWQKINRKLDEYITGSLKQVDETVEQRTGSTSAYPNSPRPLLSPTNSSGVASSGNSLSKVRNYTKLQNLLRAGKWKEANQETANRLCELVDRTQAGWLKATDIKALPTEDLQIIDQLWVKYSQGKFGFSVQKQIWQECGSPVDFGEKWEAFGDRIGWCKNGKWVSTSQLVCDLQSSPSGELPRLATNDVPVLVVRMLFRKFQS
ncbi:MAG: GUN4 domain-containing protein [Leptolyngbyaceae cyanobacterium bins.302]|nr:GUN4 domain-containing protein [Leptolyngbyaceae cyanobacterium bins.302]